MHIVNILEIWEVERTLSKVMCKPSGPCRCGDPLHHPLRLGGRGCGQGGCQLRTLDPRRRSSSGATSVSESQACRAHAERVRKFWQFVGRQCSAQKVPNAVTPLHTTPNAKTQSHCCKIQCKLCIDSYKLTQLSCCFLPLNITSLDR